MRRPGLLAALILAAAPACAEPVPLAQGLSVTLPEGWRIEGPAEGTVSKTGMRRIQLVCESEACKKTQETCTILLRPHAKGGADDTAKLDSLYASPLDRYVRLRAVLRATSRDAEIRQPLERVRIGQRDWYRVETDAQHNYKSGFFAETVVNGAYVGGICKSCETGEERHRDGAAILGSLRSGPRTSASLR
jgi:hypothetical protein